MSLGPRGVLLCLDRIREVMFDPTSQKRRKNNNPWKDMIGVLSLAPAMQQGIGRKLFSVEIKIGKVWNESYILRQLFGTESEWDWSTKPRSEVNIVCIVLWIAWLSSICRLKAANVVVTFSNCAFKPWWADCMVCMVFQSRRISWSCSARVIRPSSWSRVGVIPLSSSCVLFCSSCVMRASKCLIEKKMCSMFILSAVGTKVACVIVPGVEVRFLILIDCSICTEVRGFCRCGRHGVEESRRCVSVLIEAETMRGETNQKTIAKTVGKGVLSLAPAIAVESTLSFLNNFRSGGLRFANLVQTTWCERKLVQHRGQCVVSAKILGVGARAIQWVW